MGCVARALFLVIWGIISVVAYLINPLWGVGVFLIGFLAVALVVSSILRSSRSSHSQDVNIYIHGDSDGQERPQRRSDIQRGMDWHVPKVNKKGVDFITGGSSLRKRQQDAMRRTKKHLWGD